VADFDPRTPSGSALLEPTAGLWSNRHVLETPEEIDRLLDQADPVAARIEADKRFTYGTND
jgi:hypothetical protein